MRLESFLPFLPTLKSYTLRNFRSDMVAALTVAPMAIPQAMAYALIAGVHPQYGIYTCVLPVIVAALWGSSRFLVAGPTNAISMVLFSSLASVSIAGVAVSSMPEEMRMPYIFGITLMTGLIQIFMGFAKLGELVNFISHSVMVAFITGAALLIGAGQLNTVLGLTIEKPQGFFLQVATAFACVEQTNLWSFGTALFTIALVLSFKRISRYFPATLAALVVVSILSYLLDADEKGVKLVGAIPSVIPPLSLPTSLDFSTFGKLFMPALAVAMIGSVESLTLGKQLANIKRDKFDGSQELIGQGLGNVVAGFTSALPGCGSFTRSALMFASGGKTRFGAALSGLLALPLLFAMAPLISWLPMPALGGILIMVSIQMIKIDSLILCFTTTRVDRIVLVLTLAATLLIDLENAVFLGVIISLCLYIYTTAHPRVRRLRPNNPLMADAPADMPKGIVVYSIEGTLFFGAIHELERQLERLEKEEVRLIVLHINRVFWVDASGAHALMLFMERCYARSVPVMLVVSNRDVRETLRRAGMLDILSDGFVTRRLRDALCTGSDLINRVSCRVCQEPEQKGPEQKEGGTAGQASPGQESPQENSKAG